MKDRYESRHLLLTICAACIGVLLGSAIAMLFPDQDLQKEVASFRQEYAAHVTKEDTAATARDKQLADLKAEQERTVKVLTQELDDINRNVTGLMLRKPPVVDYRWMANHFADLDRKVNGLERRTSGIGAK